MTQLLCRFPSAVLFVVATSFLVADSRAESGLAVDTTSSGSIIELDSFLVSADGNITIFASNPLARAYGNQFTEMVYEAATYTTRQSVGSGLVVVAGKNEIHPILLMKQFLSVAGGNAALTGDSLVEKNLVEALALFDKMETLVKAELGDGIDMSVLYNFIPVPMEGPVLNLYMIGREEGFNSERLNMRFGSMAPADLLEGAFGRYDWSIYLPPRGAIDDALKEVLPVVMKKHELGFVTRKLIQGAVFTMKPMIRDSVEGMRKSVLYESILKKTSGFIQEDIVLYASAYRDALMPKGNILPGKKADRSYEAIDEVRLRIEAFEKDPFVAPEPMAEYDAHNYDRFVGVYSEDEKGAPTAFYQKSGTFWVQAEGRDALNVQPATNTLLVSRDGKSTIEFHSDEEAVSMRLEIRRVRERKTLVKRDFVECRSQRWKYIEKLKPLDSVALEVGKGGCISGFVEKGGEWYRARRMVQGAYRELYEKAGKTAGRGFLTVGETSDPHPADVLRSFLKLAEKGELPPEIAAYRQSASHRLELWEEGVRRWNSELGDDSGRLGALRPFDLSGATLELYLIAKSENDENRNFVTRFKSLTIADLENETYSTFDWALYLSSGEVFDKAFKRAPFKKKEKMAVEQQLRSLTIAAVIELLSETLESSNPAAGKARKEKY